ncbi:MAG: hypothetical protein A2832_01430 [Candidatus Zambryskibacteria bacterium RIFCSPHIGHO2_01_FULL_44_22b]|uniref:Uncharacterized protein n=1 Tax=Candidatus Zambryskibacteria bacterium RIFCSPHIGHO2_01_FULL_44_22b TaxID=1802737 RepID=A0A1G2T0G8_9BACT|nr:MAG: hypothetical protein A2832_01430 [Candidatus Zambryskibacteria bacterium RIFCSPHIGHO2_01_FULL_44_22b]
MNNSDKINKWVPKVLVVRGFFKNSWSTDVKEGLKIGLTLRPSMGAIYYLLVDMWGITPNLARSSGVFHIVWSWLSYLETADALLDSYGYCLELKYLRSVLEDFNKAQEKFPKIDLTSQLIKQGVSIADINSIPVKILSGQDKNALKIINGFPTELEYLFNTYANSMTKSNKNLLIKILLRLSRRMFSSYIMEYIVCANHKNSKILANESKIDALTIFSLKTDFSDLVDIGYIFNSRNPFVKEKKFLLSNVIKISQIFDDLIDFETDKKQINMLFYFATQYPNDFYFLCNELSKGKKFNGFFGQLNLLYRIPNTFLDILKFKTTVLKSIFNHYKFFTMTLFSVWLVKYIKKRL